jgi:mRNA interferase MazF
MTSTFEFGEVVVCVFPFTSGRTAKARPVLVLKDFRIDCLVARITSVPYKEFLDFSLVGWREAGLEKPSTIRLSRLVTLDKSLFKTRIGRLTEEDLVQARRLWNEEFRL